ncbi:MAG: hypothetical protein HC892_23405 [Saprospiraceae bacterium]|nr:hypothetical protein [Saprospiraceae bacterium]
MNHAIGKSHHDMIRYYSLTKEESRSEGRLIFDYIPILEHDGSLNYDFLIKECWAETFRYFEDDYSHLILIIEFEASEFKIGDEMQLRYASGEEKLFGKQTTFSGARFIDTTYDVDLLSTTDTLTFKLKLDDQISTLLLVKQ